MRKFRKALQDFQANDEIFRLALRISKLWSTFIFYHRYLHRLFFGTSCRPFPKPIYSLLAVIAITANVLGVWDHPHYLATTASLSLPLLSSDLPILVLPFEVWSGLLFLACANGFLSLPQLLTLLGAAVLAIYDLRFMEYPWSSGAVFMSWSSFYPVVISSCWSFLLARETGAFMEWGRRFPLIAAFSWLFFC